MLPNIDERPEAGLRRRLLVRDTFPKARTAPCPQKRYLSVMDSRPQNAACCCADHCPLEIGRSAGRRCIPCSSESIVGTLDERLVVSERPLVSVVDDDEFILEALPDLLRQLGFAVEAFSSAEAFLASHVVNQTSCLILDIALPAMSGPDLQQELIRQRTDIPIVFITAQGDGSLRQELLARGAIECLFKPFSEAVLIDALNTALRTR